jgi:transcriptional regulator of met regulon
MNRLGLVFIVVFSVDVFAKSNLSSDFYFVMKPAEFQQIIEKQVALKLDEPIDDINIEEPYKTAAQGISVEGDLTFAMAHTPHSKHHLVFEAEVSSLVLKINSIATDDEVIIQRGNIRLVTKIQGQCEGFTASYDGRPVVLQGTIDLDSTESTPKALMTIENIALADNWQMSAESCSGFAGYEDQVSQALVSLLSDKDLLIEKLHPQLQAKSQQELDAIAEQILKPQAKSLPNAGTMTFTPDRISYDHHSQSLVISGEVLSEFLGTEGIEEVPFEIVHNDLLSTHQTQVVLSKRFVQIASHQFYTHGLYKAGFESQEIKSMREFQSNRFAQFFVFPEISKFPKSANFILNGYLNTAPVIQYKGERQGVIYWNTSGKAHLDTYAPKPSGYVPFLRFFIDYIVDGWMQVKNNKLNVGFFSPEMNVKHGWFKVYLDTYNPNRWFKKDPIVKEIKELMKKTQFDFQLPRFPIESHGELQPIEVQMTDDYLQLIYELNPAP